ncbi:MAG: hypothetical protein PHE41_00810, partial [Eubacteriales bacterium]|nr:hypothetical protein [Eubacteriales bacterium]
MIRKLFRAVFTLCGALFGYGVSFLFRGLMIVTNLGDILVLSNIQKNILSIVCASVCGIIFFILAPSIGRQSKKVVDNIESDLQKVPSTEFVPGIFGLVIGVFLAYLISQLYMGIELP